MRPRSIAVLAGVAGLLGALAVAGEAAPPPLSLGSIVRISTPGSSLCPAEGEPEVTRTVLGTWVVYNDDHGCPMTQVDFRIEGLQLVSPQGKLTYIDLTPPLGEANAGDPDIAPAPDGGVYVSALWVHTGEGTMALRVMHVDRNLTVHYLPSPSFHGNNSGDDKDFLAVDAQPHSHYRGRVYLTWYDGWDHDTVLRAWTGQAWTKPVTLATYQGYPDVAVGPDGSVSVVYDDSAAFTGAYLRTSHDGGLSFGKPVHVLTGMDPGALDPACSAYPTVGVRQRVSMGPRVTYDRNGDVHVVASMGYFGAIYPMDQARKGVQGVAVVQHAVVHAGRLVHHETVTPPTSAQQWEPALAALPRGGVAVSWLQTNPPENSTYDAWIAVEPAGARSFLPPQRLSPASSEFLPLMEVDGNTTCYGIGDYSGMVSTPAGVSVVWPTTAGTQPGFDSDILLRPATAH